MQVVETRSLLISGEDPASVLYARDLARRAETLFSQTFGSVPEEMPAVHLRLEDSQDLGANTMRHRASAGLPVTVEVGWQEKTDRETLSKAIATAWWLRAARFVSGEERLPRWLVPASAAHLEVELNPLFRDHLWQVADRQAAPPDLEAVMGASGREAESWTAPLMLLSALQAMTGPPDDPQLADWLTFHSPRDLWRWFPEEAGESSKTLLQEWWHDTWRTTLAARRGAHLTLQESAAAIRRLAGPWTEAGDTSGWPGHGHPEEPLREAEARLHLIHPLYHNALLSLARLYESLLKNDAGTASRLAEQFRRDWTQAQQTETEIHALIQSPPEGSNARTENRHSSPF